MFINSTVLILGAGASWHYGYPTGEGLVTSVLSMAERLSSYCEQRLQRRLLTQFIPNYVEQKIDPNYDPLRPPTRSPIDTASSLGWEKVRDECKLLIARLKSVRPVLIDYFLAWNEGLRPIGKLMIAAAILECEAIWLRERANQNRRLLLVNTPLGPSLSELARLDITKYRDDWYRFVIHKLAYGCKESSDLLKNDVHFVTFNYDTSLEYNLFQGLRSIDLFELADVDKFLQHDRIVHVYGSVHASIPSDADAIDLDTAGNLGGEFMSPLYPDREFQPKKLFLDRCLEASANLLTVDPHDKEDDVGSLKTARNWIENSGLVYILGYGFDRSNNQRIGIEPLLRNTQPKTSGKCVMFTNFDDLNTINKSAAFLFYGEYDQFLNRSILGFPRGGDYIEKSTRTVYEALEKDFYALESELIALSKI
jgi:hypothetical protein